VQISTANTSIAPLLWSMQEANKRGAAAALAGHAIPLKCSKGGHCDPVLEAEKPFQIEVSDNSVLSHVWSSLLCNVW
jgi:hypothetical protein